MAAEYCMLICELCCAIFTKSSNLKRHTRNVHFPDRKFMCEHCSKSYNTKYNLMRHIASNHLNNSNTKSIVLWQCPLCIYESGKEIMLEHYKLIHSVDTTSSCIKFNSFDQFQSWKQNMENETYSKYIRYRNKKCSDKLKYFYRCHRDGVYKGRGNNIRRLKKIGSNKINAHCPAKIDVTINETTEEVTVKYMKTHVGHKMESSRLTLTVSDKKLLAKRSDYKQNIESAKPRMEEKIQINENLKTGVAFGYTSIKYEVPKNDASDVKLIKKSLLEKFQLILRKAKNEEDCRVLDEQLNNFESVLQNYRNRKIF